MKNPRRVKLTVAEAIELAEKARMPRPLVDPVAGRRRCGDVLRWGANNSAIDQIVALLMRRCERMDFDDDP